MEGIQKSPQCPYFRFLQHLQTELLEELDTLLKFEEDLYKTKSIIQWLNEGDANTRFFHASTLNRRKRNRINFLKDEVGHTYEDPKTIQDHILTYFSSLYTTIT